MKTVETAAFLLYSPAEEHMVIPGVGQVANCWDNPSDGPSDDWSDRGNWLDDIIDDVRGD